MLKKSQYNLCAFYYILFIFLKYHYKMIWVYIIIEWFVLKGTFKIIWFQPPCYKRGHVPLDKIVQRPSSLVLNAYREGASTSKLGNLC